MRRFKLKTTSSGFGSHHVNLALCQVVFRVINRFGKVETSQLSVCNPNRPKVEIIVYYERPRWHEGLECQDLS